MFDDFRNAVSDEYNEETENKPDTSQFSSPEDAETPEIETIERPRRTMRRIAMPREILGMTPFQNFLVSFLLLLMVVICGTFFLLITGRIMFF
jgi:hypothetical protein